MGWKNWPYWVRGGVIGLLIFLVWQISMMIISKIIPGPDPDFLNFLVIPLVVITYPIMYMLNIFEPSGQESNILFKYIGPSDLYSRVLTILGEVLFYLGALAIFFIIGAIIGLIVGKIKSKKQYKVERGADDTFIRT